MSGLIILVVVALWAGLGYVLWKSLIRPRIRSRLALGMTTVALAAVWFIGPILDEILGASEFERLCKEMPEIKFHGPIAEGPGEFFDESGRPKWNSIEEFFAIKRNTKVWERLFGDHQEWRELSKWPMPIYESHVTYFVKGSGLPSVESFYRTSPGGWIKRAVSWGMHSPYQCPSKGRFPNDEERIVFKAT